MSKTYNEPSQINPNTATGKFLEKINIVRNLQQKQELEGNKLKDLYLDAKRSGVYYYFKSIQPHYMILYFIIIIVLFTYINSINFTSKHIISLVITLGIVWGLNEMHKSQNVSRMQEIEIKMLTIFPKPKYFYIDSGLIELMFSVNEYKQYNAPIFNKLVLLLDTYLKLVLDVEKDNTDCHKTYETLQNLKKACLNNFSSFLMSLPPNKQEESKLTRATETLHYILNFHLERMRMICNDKYEHEDITIRSAYIEPSNNPRANDGAFNPNFDLF